ncbi:MAG: DUF5060 domain-containing protein [Verrucomicrobiales bacterium]|nr:DUF5060 domain-containing protein [Verrucomicrobiales bacterium]
MKPLLVSVAFCLFALPAHSRDGDGSVHISGELKSWHAVTLTVDGPFARETDTDPNPFTEIELTVQFTHASGKPTYRVPGYFAADGKAAETSATSGTKWRAHLSPDLPGKWSYEIQFRKTNGEALVGDGRRGSFEIEPSDKSGRDFRGRGRLTYIGERYLQFAGDKTRFLKAGPDAPETLLAYTDFDGTVANNPKKGPLKTWERHLQDWNEGDPTWQGEKGKGLIGALNYLAAKGLNSFSFLPYNAGGDGDNVWPFISRNEKFHYDCSKLDQWGIVFDHATENGLYLHFKLQETENDDNRRGHREEKTTDVPTSLDGGDTGPERKLYLRELIARYSHHLALNWNLGEENTQSPEQVKAMAEFIRQTDPYGHLIVIHTFPGQQDKVYPPLLGGQSALTGASLQNPWDEVHRRTAKWLKASTDSGNPWVVANDEQNPADLGVPPDPGYEGFDGKARYKDNRRNYDLHDIRRETLWGNLIAGGAGVEYYFGYRLPQNDLLCEDFRSRDLSWDYCRVALDFFHGNEIPFWEMTPNDALVGNPGSESGKPWCLAKEGEVYLIYVPAGAKSPSLKTEGLKARVFDPATGAETKDTENKDRVLLICR